MHAANTASRSAAALAIIAVTVAGCGGIRFTKARPAQVRDCKAALKVVMTPDGVIPAKPAECDPLTGGQYDTAVSDITRKARIGETSTS